MVNHLETGCIVPALQSLFAGILSGAVAAGLAFWMDLHDPWALGIIVGCCAALWLFAGGIRLWRLYTFGDVEPIAPEPVEATSSVVRVEVVQDKQVSIASLPATPEQLHELASGLLGGVPFSEASWTGAYKPFSKAQFKAIRDEFISRGLAVWVNPDARAQGITLTHPGRHVCKRLCAG